MSSSSACNRVRQIAERLTIERRVFKASVRRVVVFTPTSEVSRISSTWVSKSAGISLPVNSVPRRANKPSWVFLRPSLPSFSSPALGSHSLGVWRSVGCGRGRNFLFVNLRRALSSACRVDARGRARHVRPWASNSARRRARARGRNAKTKRTKKAKTKAAKISPDGEVDAGSDDGCIGAAKATVRGEASIAFSRSNARTGTELTGLLACSPCRAIRSSPKPTRCSERPCASSSKRSSRRMLRNGKRRRFFRRAKFSSAPATSAFSAHIIKKSTAAAAATIGSAWPRPRNIRAHAWAVSRWRCSCKATWPRRSSPTSGRKNKSKNSSRRR